MPSSPPASFSVHQDTLRISTKGRGFVDVTAAVADVVKASGITTGLCTVFVKHTSASLVVQENADPAVLRDLQAWMDRLAPESTTAYEHDDEGPDDMPGHLRASITRTNENIPVAGGRLTLGTWQAIYLWEHRSAAHSRSLVVHVAGV
jgi:secondary thiamine-phosphate synthase enzyme